MKSEISQSNWDKVKLLVLVVATGLALGVIQYGICSLLGI